MNRASQQTFVLVVLSAAIFFGGLSGGLAAFFVSQTASTIGQVGDDVADALSAQAGLQALQAEEKATVAVVDTLTPSVVSVLVEETSSDGQSYQAGGGTGFFVAEHGLILTNKHVVSNASASYIVVTSDEVEHQASVLAKDLFLDLAVLQIDSDDYPAATLGDSDALEIGQTVIAIGNTLAEFENSVTKGIISGINRTIVAGSDFTSDQEVIEQALQTDAAISQGNSGGPLINLKGEVVGVNTAVSMEGQSLGFAIPINVAKTVIDDVAREGRIVRPWLGVRYVMINKEVQKEFGLVQSRGALILPEGAGGGDSVVDGSPADQAGLLPGDVVLSVDGLSLSAEHPLGEVINRHNPGDIVTLLLVRDGLQQRVTVSLEEIDPSKL